MLWNYTQPLALNECVKFSNCKLSLFEVDDLHCKHRTENWQNRIISTGIDVQGINTRLSHCSAQDSFLFLSDHDFRLSWMIHLQVGASIASYHFFEVDDLHCKHRAENWQNRIISIGIDIQGINTRLSHCSAQDSFPFTSGSFDAQFLLTGWESFKTVLGTPTNTCFCIE